MAVTSEESAAFEHLAKGAEAPDDRILRALEAEIAGQAKESSLPAPSRRFSSRLLVSREGRIGLSLVLATLALLLTSFRGMEAKGIPVVLVALAGGLGLCSLLLPASVPGPARAHHRQRQILVGIVAGLTVLYVGVIVGEFEPWTVATAEVPWSKIVGCSVHVLLAGGLCLAALLVPWRRSDPFSPTLLGGLLGALAGYAGMLSVDAACASTEGFHVVLGHASAVAVFGLLGAALGRRWLSP